MRLEVALLGSNRPMLILTAHPPQARLSEPVNYAKRVKGSWYLSRKHGLPFIHSMRVILEWLAMESRCCGLRSISRNAACNGAMSASVCVS